MVSGQESQLCYCRLEEESTHMLFNMMFYADPLNAYVTNTSSLLEAQKEEVEAGGWGDRIVAHVTVGTEDRDTPCLDAIAAVHYLAIDGNCDSALEELAAAIFQAGVDYGRSHPK